MTLGLLTSCSTASYEPKSQRLTCPDVVEYTCEQQKQAAEELALGLTPMLSEMSRDYKVSRDQARTCAGKPLPKKKCKSELNLHNRAALDVRATALTAQKGDQADNPDGRPVEKQPGGNSAFMAALSAAERKLPALLGKIP